MADKVLIVDDDPVICKLIEKVMVSNGIEPITANTGAKALEILASDNVDLILMDIMLDDMEGFDVIHHLRSKGNTTPVIIVSGRDEDYDYLYGLSLGADDYVTKPFRPLILGAKVKALLRRSKSFVQEKDSLLICGPFTYNQATMRFFQSGKDLDLSAKEASLMLMFMKNPQMVFTKNQIYESIWGNETAVDDNTIMVYINRLRRKIEINSKEPQHIVTIRGLGYRFIP